MDDTDKKVLQEEKNTFNKMMKERTETDENALAEVIEKKLTNTLERKIYEGIIEKLSMFRKVEIENFPETQKVEINFPQIQKVEGEVNAKFKFPDIQKIVGEVIAKVQFPDIQKITGEVIAKVKFPDIQKITGEVIAKVQFPDIQKVTGEVLVKALTKKDRPDDYINVRLTNSKQFYDVMSQTMSKSGGSKAAGLGIPQHDYISVIYPNTITEQYFYKVGGANGANVAIVTVGYTDSLKTTISYVQRV